MLLASIAFCVLMTALFWLPIKIRFWWYFGVFMCLSAFSWFTDSSSAWNALITSATLVAVMLYSYSILVQVSDTSEPNRRFSERISRLIYLGWGFFAGGSLIYFGFGGLLQYSLFFENANEAFLTAAGAAENLLNLYMGLLGVFLLVQTLRQPSRIIVSPS